MRSVESGVDKGDRGCRSCRGCKGIVNRERRTVKGWLIASGIVVKCNDYIIPTTINY